MRAGEFPDGARVLRAKIDMALAQHEHARPGHVPHPARRTSPHRRHGASTRCTTSRTGSPTPSRDHPLHLHAGIRRPPAAVRLVHRRAWASTHPRQIEFARLNLTYTVMSKRKLLELVQEGYVTGWDDPRMPTLSGLRRRGYTPEAIRELLRPHRRGQANSVDRRRLAGALRPGGSEQARAARDGGAAAAAGGDRQLPRGPGGGAGGGEQPRGSVGGTRKVPFSRVLYIEREDFREDPPKQFFRLAPGREVRLRYAYFISCTGW